MRYKLGYLDKIVPEWREDICRIISVYYLRQNRLTLADALIVGGFPDEPDLIGFEKKKPTTIRWAEKARLIRETVAYEKSRGNDANFKTLLIQNFGMSDVSYAYKLLKAEQLFGGSKVENLPFERVRCLMELPRDKQVKLIKDVPIKIKRRMFTLHELRTMNFVAFRKLFIKGQKIMEHIENTCKD